MFTFNTRTLRQQVTRLTYEYIYLYYNKNKTMKLPFIIIYTKERAIYRYLFLINNK